MKKNKTNKYLIETSEDYVEEFAFKARKDICNVLESNDWKKLLLNTTTNTSSILLIRDLLFSKIRLTKIFNEAEYNSTICVQFPWNSLYYGLSKYIKKIATKKNISTIAIVHDLTSIRTTSCAGTFYYKNIVKEYKYLNNFDYVISHNEKMTKFLRDKNVTMPKIINLNLFDYITNNKNKNISNNHKIIHIAGNLSEEKAGYVYKLNNINNRIYNINLYGPNYKGKNTNEDAINYVGCFKENELISKINCGFGLVWDGNSLNECTGKYGEYLKINNPYKISLYLACSIPVIVWKESALADFVTENNIGFAVSSLNEIGNKIKTITNSDYDKYVQSVIKFRSKITAGKSIMAAINKIIW